MMMRGVLSRCTVVISDLVMGHDEPLYEGLCFSISGTDKIGIVGDNGCGKTTLLRGIARQVEPSAGEVSMSSHFKTGLIARKSHDYCSVSTLP